MLNKLTDKLHKNPKAKKLLMGTCAVVMCMTMLAPAAFAADGDSTAIITNATGIFEQVTSVVNFSTIAGVIGIGVGAALTLYLSWWGVRKLIRIIKAAFNGKFKV